MNTHTLYTSSNVSYKKKIQTNSQKKYIIYLAAILLTVILSVGVGNNFAAAKSETISDFSTHKYYKSIKLNDGDTLWNIADTYMDNSYDSIHDYIKELKEINGLTSDDIQEGQYLTIVYYDTKPDISDI